MRTIIIGTGEVGRAHAEILRKVYEVETYDIIQTTPPPSPQKTWDVMHICIRHSPDFENTARSYVDLYKPLFVNVCTTVPPGTCQRLDDAIPGADFVHSTTRGLHPNLVTGLLTIPKHVGGPESRIVADYFEKAGLKCVAHKRAITTELAHVLNNVAYGYNLMAADEMARICRKHGVDYQEAVIHYTMTNNEGYHALDHASKARMILTPPGGRIGGHCVVMSAGLISDGDEKTPMLNALAKYNG